MSLYVHFAQNGKDMQLQLPLIGCRRDDLNVRPAEYLKPLLRVGLEKALAFPESRILNNAATNAVQWYWAWGTSPLQWKLPRKTSPSRSQLPGGISYLTLGAEVNRQSENCSSNQSKE